LTTAGKRSEASFPFATIYNKHVKINTWMYTFHLQKTSIHKILKTFRLSYCPANFIRDHSNYLAHLFQFLTVIFTTSTKNFLGRFSTASFLVSSPLIHFTMKFNTNISVQSTSMHSCLFTVQNTTSKIALPIKKLCK